MATKARSIVAIISCASAFNRTPSAASAALSIRTDVVGPNVWHERRAQAGEAFPSMSARSGARRCHPQDSWHGTDHYGGSFSYVVMPCGNWTQGWRRQSYTESSGGGNVGSANAPTATATPNFSRPSSVWKTVVPHTGQNRNRNLAPWSPVRTYSVAVPETV